MDLQPPTLVVSSGAGALNLSAGFNPAAGTQFTIIDNDGTDAVSGTFAGLPEGASVSAGGKAFTISYKGGTGNEVYSFGAATTAEVDIVIELLGAPK